ncbi:hypothetical protein CF060_13655 [Clostridium botulinum]|uniref:hypothetical protein n=1 Tax=Clostridium botulinum TaxID=1491 RepID=UPI0009475654|nr:hypothetical protein [Clostridium botulinum]APQ77501.1 hypothetical protein RSJ10_437 [Clostridium botulinum]AUM97757.1 hypothetical protein RSJ13_01435 [Clostridium botulinum]MBN3355480.1 hypothetical protein [Clostridium botulinum]QDY27548.1 hypothetical protein CGQ41_01470 [Clostridium botulinum]
MKSIQLEVESIQISIYCEIIINLLKKHNELSLIKSLVFAYLIRKGKFMPNKIYNANNTKDIVCKCISLLAGDYEEFCNSIQYIIKSIYLLIGMEIVSISDNLLVYTKNMKLSKITYNEDSFMEKAVENSKNMTDRQFLKEVIQNV